MVNRMWVAVVQLNRVNLIDAGNVRTVDVHRLSWLAAVIGLRARAIRLPAMRFAICWRSALLSYDPGAKGSGGISRYIRRSS